MPVSRPLAVGDTLELTIEQVVFGGDGLARHEGFVLFIPFTAAGERVEATVTEVRKGYARAELLHVSHPAEERQEPFCPYFTKCGGCAYQHVGIKTQRHWKQGQVAQLLRRICHLDFPVKPILGGELDRAYRNRITMACRDRVIGFHRHRQPERLIDIEACPLASEEVNHHLKRFRESSRGSHEGPVTIREPGKPRHFTQTNPEVAALLRSWVETHAGTGRLLLDFFGGDGSLSRALADRFEQVFVIEQSPAAVRTGKKECPGNVQFLEGPASSTPLPPEARTFRSEETVVIVDPPRTGLDQAMRQRLIEIAPSRLLYVSCDPSTCCRDLKALTACFELEEIQPFDMFPQTGGVELGVALRSIIKNLP